MQIRYDDRGLVPAVAQDRMTGEIRMLAWMSAESLEVTRASGFATFFSRSRGALWQKGEQSGHRLRVERIAVDCDADALVLLVDPEGPTCHTGAQSCFFRDLEGQAAITAPYLAALESTVRLRAEGATADQSYTRSLLDAGAPRLTEKLVEEAQELGQALAAESAERVAAEAADLVFHLLVALRSRGVEVRTVIETLAKRSGVGGHAEKAARNSSEIDPGDKCPIS